MTASVMTAVALTAGVPPPQGSLLAPLCQDTNIFQKAQGAPQKMSRGPGIPSSAKGTSSRFRPWESPARRATCTPIAAETNLCLKKKRNWFRYSLSSPLKLDRIKNLFKNKKPGLDLGPTLVHMLDTAEGFHQNVA